MLVTEYLVGRQSKGGREGEPLCLIVNSVLPTDCKPGRADLARKMHRKDLILEFVQDGAPVEWISLPDLPADVVELLSQGRSIPVIDSADWTCVVCRLQAVEADLPDKLLMVKA
ncbi:hypothetical protein HN51_24460 [Ectopseudomonas mendocina]|jgi:hypothetical protein|uniref:Uncharacterized protein n=1 Tax=Ectopseudomonas mendocina S5.2 TaxID=1225174 RepID=A0ABN4J1Y3_ECTME|nr:hypothetical protein DW68_025225 [Pseudomonas mendocina S5.2]KER97966.1 hypothetical protein HN51_24460 [Pseudomonas mendocina]OEO24610.1 hypothetical protein AX279_18260 [Pseudomonas sp. J237]